MVECRYCSESFPDEEAYLDHLAADHDDELSTIDRRRVSDRNERTRSLPISPTGIGVAIGIAIFAGIVIWGLSALSGGNAGSAGDAAVTPTDLWSVHKHGTIEMRVLGTEVDFSRSKYQLQADAFHFENGNGDRWHVHARDVTLEYAMSTLGIEVNASAVTFEGTTYRDGSPRYEVIITVDGEPVTPSTYRLKDGDHVRIIVRNESTQATLNPRTVLPTSGTAD